VDAVEERVIAAYRAGIAEQLIFKADLKPSVAIRPWAIDGIDRRIARQIAKESIASTRLRCG